MTMLLVKTLKLNKYLLLGCDNTQSFLIRSYFFLQYMALKIRHIEPNEDKTLQGFSVLNTKIVASNIRTSRW
jgi:hypothetical protein